jgi:hypothetical protein
MERLRVLARHNEASALAHASRKAAAEEREKWQGVIADNEARLADNEARLADKEARIAELEALLRKNGQT